MLRINLLPEGARTAALPPIEQFHRMPLVWLGVVVMIGFVGALFLPVTLRRRQLQQLTNRIQVLEPKKEALEQLQRRLQQLRVQEAAFRHLQHDQGLWSKRLNTLSNVTPDGVWFTELSLDPKKGLVIQGSAIEQSGGTEMGSVGRLVHDLKADADFSSAFKDIQIESIKRVQEKEIEIVQFTLTCSWLEALGR